ncbi:MAG: TonB-dependent receptor [Vicinamibacteraceae bacterium]|nr:TonB-dependent receptor [Vicinamibacteraceae bacterium]
MRKAATVVLAVGLVWLAPRAVMAQSDLGSITGYVVDQSKAVLPGVTVTLRGPAIMGSRVAVSDQDGFYRLLNVPPGECVLVAELPGFAQVQRPGIVMRAGLNLTIDLQMQLGQMSEVVEVTGAAPLLETEKADRRLNVTGDFLRALPLSPGHDWWDAMQVVPGVQILGGSGGVLESRGGGLSSNMFLLEGIDVSDVQQNYAGGTQIPVDSVADIRISTTGQDASSRMAVGANLNMITKSGSNQIAGTFTTDLQPKRLNDSNIPGGSPADQTIFQYSGTLGGPVVFDRLWYFGSYRYISQTNGIARKPIDIETVRIFEPDYQPFSVELPVHQLMAKATYRISPADQAAFIYQYNRTDTRNNGNDPRWTQQRALGQFSGGPMYGGTYQRVFGQRATLDAQGGGWNKPFEVKPQGSGPNVIVYPGTLLSGGRLTGQAPKVVDMGNVQSVNRSEQRRRNANVDLQYFFKGLKGTHQFAVGGNYLWTEYTFVNTVSNDGFILEEQVLLDPSNPAGGTRPFHRRYQDPIKLPGTGKASQTFGFYVQDTWRPGQRWVLNLGVRFDRAQAQDTWGDTTQASWQGGPRLGATYQITSDGRNVLRLSYNRMYDAINNLFLPSEGSLSRNTRDIYDLDGNGTFETEFTTPGILTRPTPATGATRSITRSDLKQPRTEEFSVGYSRQLPWQLVADATFVYRQYKDRMVGVDINGIYENGQFLGYRDPNFNAIIEARNTDRNWFVYKGLDLTLSKSLSHNLQFLVGYTYANLGSRGTWEENDPAGLLQPIGFESDKGIGRTVYVVSSQVNSLSQFSFYNTGTPPHSFKFNATYVAPFDITVGVSYTYQMGQWSGPIYTLIPASEVPVPTTVRLSTGRVVSNPLATRTRFLYSDRDEGQVTAPALSQLNLRLGKQVRVGQAVFEAALQGFNLFNRGESLSFSSPTLVQGEPMRFNYFGVQSPRAGQVTLSVRFR